MPPKERNPYEPKQYVKQRFGKRGFSIMRIAQPPEARFRNQRKFVAYFPKESEADTKLRELREAEKKHE